jgi:hypothetical protein
MNKSDCQKLTAAVSRLQTLQGRVDLAIQKFEPAEGIIAKTEAMKAVHYCQIERYFDEETYRYLLENIGDEAEIKKRFNVITMTGKTGPQLSEELENEGIELSYSSAGLFQDPEFGVAKAGEKIPTIVLTPKMLFSNKKAHTYRAILERAAELGLGFLPHETAANFQLYKRDKTSLWDNSVDVVTVSMKYPEETSNIGPVSFNISHRGSNYDIFCSGTSPTSAWENDRELMFRVYKNKIDVGE